MEGVFYNRGNLPKHGLTLTEGATAFELLAKQGPMEIMHLQISASDTTWLARAEDDGVMEFFYLLSGALTLGLPEGPLSLAAGDSFYINRLRADVPLRADEDTEMLYVTNSPMFDSARVFEDNLKQLMLQINEKDHYTYQQSGNVMHYARALYGYFREECDPVTLDDL
ncbi:MAG: cupin domain-containing protein, partial [Clostridia bacterium]|nr:cupin domain-containing protein [Clostridia bacterium]